MTISCQPPCSQGARAALSSVCESCHFLVHRIQRNPGTNQTLHGIHLAVCASYLIPSWPVSTAMYFYGILTGLTLLSTQSVLCTQEPQHGALQVLFFSEQYQVWSLQTWHTESYSIIPAYLISREYFVLHSLKFLSSRFLQLLVLLLLGSTCHILHIPAMKTTSICVYK